MGVCVNWVLLLQAVCLLGFSASLLEAAVTAGPKMSTKPTVRTRGHVTKGPRLSEAYELIDTTTCGKTKGCYRMPYGCTRTQDCTAIFTWKIVRDKVEFELGGQSEGWVAIGLSKDNQMGEDSVMECFYLPKSDKHVTARFSWNTIQRTNEVLQSSLKDTMEKTTSRFYNNYMVCKFNRPLYTVQRDSKIYPIQEPRGKYQSYFLQLALGKMQGDKKLKHAKHIPRITTFRVQFDNMTDISSAQPVAALSLLTLISLVVHAL